MFLKCDDWRCTINLYIIAFRVIIERLLSHLTIRYSEKRVGEIRLFFLCDKLERINAHNKRVHVPSVLVQQVPSNNKTISNVKFRCVIINTTNKYAITVNNKIIIIPSSKHST
nr:MAG TPA: hypothetical protein [Caudoviricetes sp.]